MSQQRKRLLPIFQSFSIHVQSHLAFTVMNTDNFTSLFFSLQTFMTYHCSLLLVPSSLGQTSQSSLNCLLKQFSAEQNFKQKNQS